MLKASSFDTKVYRKFKIIIDIQKILFNLTKENIKSSFKEILKKKEKIKNEIGIPMFIKCFNDVVNFNPKNIENIVDFIILIKNNTNKSKFKTMIKSIVGIIHTKEKLTSSDLFYLRLLYDSKVITTESIIDEIECFVDDKIIKNVVKWFYYEIKNKTKYININKYIDGYIIKTSILKTGYNNDYIAEVIRNDDIDSFCTIVGLKGNKFDFNQTIKKTGFERCDLLLNNPSLIEYAAFFNSIKIFKYLYLNKASLINNKKYSLLDYAICGGSIEIIHILEHEKFNINDSISIAIKYYQNDIFSWIVDNYSSSNKFNNDYIIDEDKDKDDIFKNAFLIFVHENYYPYFFENVSEIKINSDEIVESDSCYNFDAIFDAIVKSNNILPLFVLFSKGISINARNEISKKTILHYAIKEGNYLLVDLLLSCKMINPTLHDENDETAIIYSIKYKREKIFFDIMEQFDKDISLSIEDYYKMVQYCQVNKLDSILNYFIKNWPFDLYSNLSVSLKYLPFCFFKDTFEHMLDCYFMVNDFANFLTLACRVAHERSLFFSKTFYINDLNVFAKVYCLFKEYNDNNEIWYDTIFTKDDSFGYDWFLNDYQFHYYRISKIKIQILYKNDENDQKNKDEKK